MERGQPLDRGTVRDRYHLPVVRPLPQLALTDPCGITVVSALTESTDPWYLGDAVWELEKPVPYERDVRVNSSLGIWPVSEVVRKKFERARDTNLDCYERRRMRYLAFVLSKYRMGPQLHCSHIFEVY